MNIMDLVGIDLPTLLLQAITLLLQAIIIIHLVLAVFVSLKAIKSLRDVELAVGIFLAWCIPIVGSLISLRLINLDFVQIG